MKQKTIINLPIICIKLNTADPPTNPNNENSISIAWKLWNILRFCKIHSFKEAVGIP
jgi:hypothetical protein